MSHVGSIILALVAAKVQFRFKELEDVVHILTGERITESSLLRETYHLVDIEWKEVPIVRVCHRDVMTFLREEAELPKIDMVELCRLGIELDGPFSEYALRNWSTFCSKDDDFRKFDNYLSRFKEFRKKTFLALNDGNNVKFYGTHVDHLRAWHGLSVSSEEPDQRRSRPIHIAASRGHAKLIQELLSAQSQDWKDGRGRTLFQIAIEHDNLNVYEKLPTDLSAAIEHKAYDFAIPRITPDTKDIAALHTAIRLNHQDRLNHQEIVKKFPQSLRDDEAHRLMLRKMPELLSNTHIKEEWLPYASQLSEDFLLEKGLTYCPVDKSSPLHDATFEESQNLLKHADSVDAYGQTPLWNAFNKRDMQLINLLLEHTNVDIVDENGMTVLDWAWDEDKDIALKMIGKAKKLKSRRLAEMLKYAIKHNRQDSVKTLVMKGADLWVYAELGSLPSQTARSRGANDNTIELVRQMQEIFIEGRDLCEIDHLKVVEDNAETQRR